MMKRMVLVLGIMVLMMGKSSGDDNNGVIYMSGLFTLPNIIINIGNLYQINQPKSYKHDYPDLGVVLGGAQIGYGGYIYLINHNPNSESNIWKDQIAFFNMGFGAATIILSKLNIEKSHKPQDTRTSLNPFSMPVNGKNMAMGMSFKFRF